MQTSQVKVVAREAGAEPKTWHLTPGSHLVGRDDTCAVRLVSADVSRQHARLVWSGRRLEVEDLGSKTGTRIDGQHVKGRTEIGSAQRIQVGSAVLDISLLEPTPSSSSPAENRMRSRKYQIDGPIAEGGMGTVLAARDLHVGRTVAMKVMRPEVQGSEELRRRFLREAEVLGQLEHPNIVPMHDLGLNAENQPFYTMKFVNGVTLAEAIEELKTGAAVSVARYPLSLLLTLFQKVCDAIAFAHSKGIVHRDLKPENIMIGEFGEVLVMDWGLAKILAGKPPHKAEGPREPEPREPETAEIGAAPPENPADLTQAGAVMGTPRFMAPEQVEGRVDDIDARTDVFALGGVLYQILTLRPPVGGASAAEVFRKIRTGEILPPAHFNDPKAVESDGTIRVPPLTLAHCPGRRVPESLSAVVMKAMSVRREDRYQAVRDLQREIQAYQDGFATVAEQAGLWKLATLWVRRHKTVSIAALALVLVVTGFLGRVLASERKAQARLADLRKTAPTFFAQARSLIEERRLDEALEKIEYALKLAPETAGYHTLAGHIHQTRLELAEALQAYARALKLNPRETLAAENLKICESLLAEGRSRTNFAPATLEELRQNLVRQGRSAEALVLAARAGQRSEQLEQQVWSQLTLALQKAGLKQTPGKDEQGRLHLDIRGAPVSDLSFLRGFPLATLNLSDCIHVTDLGLCRVCLCSSCFWRVALASPIWPRSRACRCSSSTCRAPRCMISVRCTACRSSHSTSGTHLWTT